MEVWREVRAYPVGQTAGTVTVFPAKCAGNAVAVPGLLLQEEIAFGDDGRRAGKVDVAVEAQIDGAGRRQHAHRRGGHSTRHRHGGRPGRTRTAAHGLAGAALPEPDLDGVLDRKST